MNQPERFDLFCINEKGEKERIVMIHAAIMGSIDRFLSILIEHTAGQLPSLAFAGTSKNLADFRREALRLRKRSFQSSERK